MWSMQGQDKHSESGMGGKQKSIVMGTDIPQCENDAWVGSSSLVVKKWANGKRSYISASESTAQPTK